MSIIRNCLRGLFILAGSLAAQDLALPELAPWYTQEFEIRPTAAYFFRSSRNISADNHSFHRNLNGHFFKLSALTPVFQWCGEVDMLLADTSMRAFGIDCFSLSMRYGFADDVSDSSSVSIVGGGTLRFASKAALNDLNSFHHGRFEALGHIACGKEWSQEQYWTYRIWGMALLGLSDVGSPWSLAQVGLERNWCDVYQLKAFLGYLCGFGGQSLHKHGSFHGYGPINHRSLDAAIRYNRAFECGLNVCLEYRRTIYSYNYPKDINTIGIAAIYPFGL
jgi:hypothetical protein